MNTLQIERIVDRAPFFKGFCPHNQVSDKLNLPVSLIMKLDNSEFEGSHLVVIYVISRGSYFDSFAQLEPPSIRRKFRIVD